ncbi:hypothetical protein [Paenibacillus sp. NAIST15-1]|uniref:hypothetical protein n=1 Tax=Paenibacillus sp. NAIST15-1 TaxID=1605994 RepID=UPI00086D2A00|nr:hypothetical protein [Paenibacillus sp. NAIST15-1]GAV11348.1 hypothetical protein PBN151_1275 [Paenibacillus sp. NAIST15-1]
MLNDINRERKNEKNWKETIDSLGTFPQRQDSVVEQLEDLVYVANKLGFYDAADIIKVMAIREHRKAFKSE